MRGRPRHLLAAAGFASALIFGSPFVGEIRAALARAFPVSIAAIIEGSVVVAIVAAMAMAIARISYPSYPSDPRDTVRGPQGGRRVLRYSALLTAVVAGVLFDRVLRTGDRSVDVVEAFHFVEYGLLTLLFYLAWRPIDDGSVFVLPMLAGLLVGVLDEWFQWFVPSRVGELRDVALDGVAVACGLLFSIAVKPPDRFTLAFRRGSMTRGGLMAALVILAAALFFQSVYLGYEIRDPRTGTFRSRYTAAELEAAAHERLTRWRDRPPLTARLVSREDQYMSEALWHVRRRNEAVSHGDSFVAWRENGILEAFYGPVLDTPSFAGASGLRWPAEQRAAVASEVGVDGRPYVSDAQPYAIRTWSRSRFWMVTALAMGLVLVVCLFSEGKSR